MLKKLFIILFILTSGIISARTLNNIVISPKNRVNFYFDTTLTNFQTELSEDKNKITLRIKNTFVDEHAKRAMALKPVKDVYVRQMENDLEIFVLLAGKFGYTANFLPYTRNLILEVFKWNELTPSQDKYRTGLLAIQDNVAETAENELSEATRNSHPNASAFLGLLYLKQGKINNAKKCFLAADALNSDINDIYAGLAQIHYLKMDSVNGNKYKDIFLKRSRLNEYVPLDISEDIIDYSAADNKLFFIGKIINEAQKDTTQDTVVADNFKNLFPDTLRDTTASSSTSFLPWWTEYVLMVIAAILLIIIYRYVKWRKEQIENTKKKDKQTKKPDSKKFNKELKRSEQNLQINSNLAQKTYQKSQKSNENIPKKRQVQPQKPAKIKPEEKAGLQKAKTKKKSLPPKLQLAQHLAREQQSIKNSNLDKLKDFNTKIEPDKLNQVAKQLGIEKGSIETKKTLEQLEKDPQKLSELAKKFSSRNK